MTTPHPLDTPALAARRARLGALLGSTPALITSGAPPPRNYPANTYEFRASSHFLYFAGLSLQDAALLLHDGRALLFLPPPAEDDPLWHGPLPTWDEIAQVTGVDQILPLQELAAALSRLPAPARLPLPATVSAADEALAQAVIQLRLSHDAAALHEMRRAAAVTDRAHRAGMAATRPGVRESVVRAAMEAPILAADFTTAYPSIVTIRGEVLHNHSRAYLCQAGDLLLADVGSESDTGWASDVTRTWPVSGRFSPTQRALYDLVLAAQLAAIAQVAPGVGYRDVHRTACRVLCQGLRDEGILRGEIDGLLERGAHALFFPHGVGHLLGLDVHDMEDLGDRAGYAPGRTRAAQFGLCYLRLDRDLQPGMSVTIEPGLYLVPSILDSPRLCGPFAADLDRDRLLRFADVRGIRIEDDVVVTATGCEVLTAAIPKQAQEVEALVGRAA